MFPAGLAGIALLSLRFCVIGTVLLALDGSGDLFAATLRNVATLTFAVLLFAGLFTPATCTFALVLQATGHRSAIPLTVVETAIHMLMTASLLMLGPGAYSVDARLFGRRLIVPPAQ